MRARVRAASALVFGGTGAVGRAVVEGLARAGVPTVFTYCRSTEQAESLTARHGQRAVRLDLCDLDAIRRLVSDLEREGAAPNVFIHCAGVTQSRKLGDITEDDWRTVHLVNGHGAFVASQELARSMSANGEGDIVFVGALDRGQSLPAPVHFAASQGMLSAMTMALGKELGPRGIRVNMVALGLLQAGLSREMTPGQVADYESYSALRRTGTPEEAARAILWLALENTYMNGKVLPVNGGL
jgi:3-oxoacyl-[acyl-carrier protein] reductase